MKKRAMILICLVIFAIAAPVAAQSATVRLVGFDGGKFPTVRAFVSVTDSTGRAVTALKKEAFKLTEDGRDAEVLAINVSNEPIYVGLVIDHSGSMDEQNKLRDALTAADAFVDEMRSQDEAFVATFSDQTTLLTDFTSDHTVLKNAIRNINGSGGTALYDAVYESAGKFSARKDKLKKALIVLTDGLDNREVAGGFLGLFGAGSKHTLAEATNRAKEFQIALYTIGLGRDADQSRLEQMASGTGGKFFFAPSGDQLKQLYLMIAEQLQKDYAVDFASPRPLADGTRRSVRVTVTLPSGATQTVDGVYVAGFLFNRVHANWLVGALIGLMLLTMGVVPSAARRAWSAVNAPSSRAPLPAPPPATPPVAASSATCPRCAQPVRADARFCPYCRTLLRCPSCGNAIRAGAKFCGVCRHRLVSV